MSPLERRANAARATLDEFRKRPFRLGRDDCLKLALFHLKQAGVKVRLGVKPYKTVSQAKAELKRLGAKTVGELFDRHFERIPYASAIVGDLVELEGQRGLGGLAVYLGNQAAAGYHESVADKTAEALRLHEVIAAWRVPVKAKSIGTAAE